MSLLDDNGAQSQIRTASGDRITVDASRIVVTSSAIHLLRATMMLERHGALVTQVPTDFLVREAPWYRPDAYFIYIADRVFHEWVGMLWFELCNDS